MTVKTFFNM